MPFKTAVLQNDPVYGRDAQNQFEAERFEIPLRAYHAKASVAVPLSYVVDVQVGPDEKQDVVRVEYFYVTEDEEVAHFRDWFYRNALQIVGYDLETSDIDPMDGRIATLQIGNPVCAEPRAYVFDVRAVSLEALAPVFDILRDTRICKLGQNTKFEAKWSQWHWGVEIRNLADTQVTELVMRAGLWTSKLKKQGGSGGERAAYKHTSMAALSARYLGIDIDKDHDLRTSFYKTPVGAHSLRQIVYAASDVIYPFYIARQQRVHIEARKLKNICKIEYGVIPVLADAELTGFRMDTKRWRALWQESVKGRAEAEKALDALMLNIQPDLFGGTDANVRPIYTGAKKPQPLNYSSSAQVKWAIKQYCGSIGWKHKIITTLPELKKLKIRATQPYQHDEPRWIDAMREWLLFHPAKTYEDLPDYLLPEDEFCVLLKADKIALILAKCRGQLPANFVDLLLQYSQYDIRCNTFGAEFLKKHLRPETGCVHTEFHQCVTSTGRLSSSPNLQNVPGDKRYRRCFIPKEGYVFVTCDYSQIEPRITAQLSGDETYSITFHTDDDLYLMVAEAMLGYRPNTKSEDPDEHAKAKVERAIFKTVVLALAYNMGPHKLRDRLTIALHKEIMSGQVPAPTFAYAKDLYDRFFEIHKAVRAFQKQCIHDASPTHTVYKGDGTPAKDAVDIVPNPRKIWDDFVGGEVTWVTAPCGRKRFFPPDATAVFTEAPNVPPQAGSATITKAAAVLMQREIDVRGWDAHVVNLVHDELVYEVREEYAKEFAIVMKAVLEKAGQFYCPDIPIRAEYPEGTDGITEWWTKELTEEDLVAA